MQVWWLVGGAFSMGVGIWAMHYIGMLAFSLPLPVLSICHGFVFAAGRHRGERDRALYRQPPTDQELVNIAGQRFHGMRNCSDALHRHGCNALAARPHYNPAIVGASVGLAIGISYVALILSFGFARNGRPAEEKS